MALQAALASRWIMGLGMTITVDVWARVRAGRRRRERTGKIRKRMMAKVTLSLVKTCAFWLLRSDHHAFGEIRTEDAQEICAPGEFLKLYLYPKLTWVTKIITRGEGCTDRCEVVPTAVSMTRGQKWKVTSPRHSAATKTCGTLTP